MKHATWWSTALAVVWVAACAGDVTPLGELDEEGGDGSQQNDANGASSASDGGDGETITVGSTASSGTVSGGQVDGTGGSPEAFGAASDGTGGGVTVGGVVTTGEGRSTGSVGFAASTASTGAGEVTSGGVTGGGVTDGSPDTSGGVVGVGGAPSGGVTSGGTTGYTNCALPELECHGLCFGTSCDGEWRCHLGIACDGAEVAWCGCDGETFYAPSDCPTRPFVSIGECLEMDE